MLHAKMHTVLVLSKYWDLGTMAALHALEGVQLCHDWQCKDFARKSSVSGLARWLMSVHEQMLASEVMLCKTGLLGIKRHRAVLTPCSQAPGWLAHAGIEETRTTPFSLMHPGVVT